MSPSRIEDYALISDCVTGALVGADGSIDWLCLPRYDSPSVFGAVLGDERHGFWRLRPADPDAVAHRSYDGDTFTLVTRWMTVSGVVEIIELMPTRRDGEGPMVLRRVRGIEGEVELEQELRLRFDYARSLPWVMQRRDEPDTVLLAAAGPDAVVVRSPTLSPHAHSHTGRFVVTAGQIVDLSMAWHPSHQEPPSPPAVGARIERTRQWWDSWIAPRMSRVLPGLGAGIGGPAPRGPFGQEYAGEHAPSHHANTAKQRREMAVKRSLLVLRALTNPDTGGIVAAATTSLPEQPGGSRNWDYRYVWLRDASLTIDVLLRHRRFDVIEHWRDWLLRAIAGSPDEVQIMYGIGGERELPERNLDSLPGYSGAAPVRVGNAASEQFQADVIGETMIGLAHARDAGVAETRSSWSLQCALLTHLEKVWHEPDQGIWEIRGPAQAFTHSRAMAWAAFDRGVRATEKGLNGPADRWAALRDEIAAEINEHGFNAELNSFVQHYESTEVDAALLQLPQIGFCAPDDPRMLGTVAKIESDLINEGFVMRYRTTSGVDGLSGGENPFLACSFWLAEQYARSGRYRDAEALLERLLEASNDLGLLSEEFNPITGEQIGNTPQALSHLTLIRAVDALDRAASV